MRINSSILLIAVLPLIFLGSSCHSSSNDFSFQLPEKNTEWQQIHEKVFYREFAVLSNEKAIELIVYKFDSADFTANLAHDQPQRLAQWAEELQPNLLINGGFFNENNEPTGWVVVNGEVKGTNQYSPDLSGILLIEEGKADLIDSLEATSTVLTPTTSILQSFPVLIHKGGKPGITENSDKIARRTVLAKNLQDEFLVIIVDQTPVSLFDLMQGLQNSDLSIDLALNLDGGPSTGLIAQIADHSKSIIPLTPLPQVVSFSIHPQEK